MGTIKMFWGVTGLDREVATYEVRLNVDQIAFLSQGPANDFPDEFYDANIISYIEMVGKQRFAVWGSQDDLQEFINGSTDSIRELAYMPDVAHFFIKENPSLERPRLDHTSKY